MPSTAGMRTPNRRMTMGAIPSSTKRGTSSNRRLSVTSGNGNTARKPPNPGTTSKPSRPPMGRKSMIPRVGRENVVPPSPANSATASTAASRRRSIGGGGHERPAGRRQSLLPPSAPPSVVKSDPRPITDKAFQLKCIKRLLQFLEQVGYPFPITQKSLTRPSAKDFSNIVTFMLQLVDPSFQTGGMKLEDEVCMNFKNIGYPFTISKTALVAAGSPHTWPTLLAALTWLMEHLQCRQHEQNKDDLRSTEAFNSLSELNAKTDRAFFQFLGESYQAFMKGDNEMIEQLENDLVQRFEYDDQLLMEESERMTDVNATLLEQIETMKEEINDLSAYSKKRQDYETELEQFLDLIQHLDDHKAALQKKVEQRTTDLADTNSKLEKMNCHIADLKEAIKSQEFSQDDVLRLESESKRISEAIERLTVMKDEKRQIIKEAENQLNKCYRACEVLISKYNSTLVELGDVYTDCEDWKLSDLEKDKLLEKNQSQILGKDLEGQIQPAVEAAKAELRGKKLQANQKYEDALDQLERTSEVLQEAVARKHIVEEKITKCEEALNNESSMHETKLSVRQREVEAMESKVSSYSDPLALEEQIAAYERQCAELERLQAQHQEENISRVQSVCREIDEACRLMSEHEQHFREKLAELDSYKQKKEEAAGELELPTNVELDD